MPLQNFVDNSLPTVKAAWLNSIDAFYTTLFNGATTAALARTALGSGAIGDSLFAAATVDVGRALLNTMRQPGVTMVCTGTSTWTVYDETGAVMSVVGTTTNGFQEALTYCWTNGKNLLVCGAGTGAIPGLDYGLLTCTTAVAVPPLRNFDVQLLGVHLIFSAAVTGDGLTFDSMMQSRWYHSGEIVYNGNAAAVRFNPTTALPVDTKTSIQVSQVTLGNISIGGGTNGVGIRFSGATHGIVNTWIEVPELNGGVTFGQHAIVVDSASANGFVNNSVTCYDIHGWTGTALRVGTGASTSLYGNIWNLNLGDVAIGIDTYGRSDVFNLTISGTVTTGILLEAGAAKNQFNVPYNVAVTPVTDSSTTVDNIGMYGDASASISALIDLSSGSPLVADITVPANALQVILNLSLVSTNGVSPMQVQLGDAGGVEVSSTYSGSMTRPSIGVTAFTTGFVITFTNVAADTYSGSVTLTLVNRAANTWAETSNIADSGVVQANVGAGNKSTSQPMTTVRLTTVNGSDAFNAGVVSAVFILQ